MRRKKTLKSWAAGAGRRDVIRRAASDLEQGQKDTDCRGQARSSGKKGSRKRS
jgi:hypothetical protein